MSDSNGTYPSLNIDIGQSAQRPTKRPISALEQTVEGALREVLAWRPRATDPKGFQAALNQAFTSKEVNGRSEWTWTPRSYSALADMGAITGAQASIYTRAKAALDQIIPLIEGLYPLRNDPDPEDIEAMRALVQTQLSELTDELGMVGGPRLPRIEGLFTALLGNSADDPAAVAGFLGELRDRLGLESHRVNTIAEEQNLTNFRIIADQVIGLQRSWGTLADYFRPDGTDKFLGTQMVLLSRALNVVAESVQELEFKFDSVWIGEAERQTTLLDSGLTIAELLDWVRDFTGGKAQDMIREAGKDGVIALQPTLEQLHGLVNAAWQQSLQPSNNPQPGFHQDRIRTGWQELTLHLREAVRLAGQIHREPPTAPLPRPVIRAVFPDSAERGSTVLLRVDGEHFQDGAQLRLNRSGPSRDSLDGYDEAIYDSSRIYATFDLSDAKAVAGEWTVVVLNPDGGFDWKVRAFTIFDPPYPGTSTLPATSPRPPRQPLRLANLSLVSLSGSDARLDPQDTNDHEWQEFSGIRFAFNKAPDVNTFITSNDLTADPRTFTLLIKPLSGQFAALDFVPGEVFQESPQIIGFKVDLSQMEKEIVDRIGELRGDVFPPGEYEVTLFGDADKDKVALAARDGLKLDGDGNGDEGGNLTFTFTIHEEPTIV